MTRSKLYYGGYQIGNIVIDGNTISSLSGDINFSVTGTSQVNINYGSTSTVFGGTGTNSATQRNPRLVTVSLSGGGGDYISIKNAIDSITGATYDTPYAVNIAPGIYMEDTIQLKPYIDINGSGLNSTFVYPNNINEPIFLGQSSSSIRNLMLVGSTGVTGTAIKCIDHTTNSPFVIDNVKFAKNNCFIDATTTLTPTNSSVIKLNNIIAGFESGISTGFNIHSSNITGTVILLSNGGDTYNSYTGSGINLFNISGVGAEVHIIGMHNEQLLNAGNAVYISEGSKLHVSSSAFHGYDTCFNNPSGGVGCELELSSNTIDANKFIYIGNTGTTGEYVGEYNYDKIYILPSSQFHVTHHNDRIITVSTKGGDFSSIAAAVNYITNSSETNRWVVHIQPGIYIEPLIDLTSKPYVNIRGDTIQSAVIKPDGNHNIFELGAFNEISFLWLEDAPSGYAGISVNNSGDYSQAHKITFNNCDIGVYVQSYDVDTYFYGEFLDTNGQFTNAYKVVSSLTGTAYASLEICSSFPTYMTGCTNIYVSGENADVDWVSSEIEGISDIGIYVANGAHFFGNSVSIIDQNTGLSIPNIGIAPTAKLINVNFKDCIQDINILHPSTLGVFQGVATSSKITVDSTSFILNYLDFTTAGIYITDNFNMRFDDNTTTNIGELILDHSGMGLLRGGSLTGTGGLNLTVMTGTGYLKTSSTDILREFSWNPTGITLTANSENYIYFNENGILSKSSNRPNTINNILLGRVITNNSNIELINDTPLLIHHYINNHDTFLRDGLGSIYHSGGIVTENITPFHLNVSSGVYFYANTKFTPAGGANINFDQYYMNGTGGWNISTTNTILSKYDNTTGALIDVDSGKFTKHTLYQSSSGIYEKYFLVMGQTQYSTLVEAEGADLPIPPFYFDDGIVSIASIIIDGPSSSNIIEIIDIRPVIGYKATGVSVSSVHSNLLGLSADDHTQYILTNGGRVMTGNLQLGSNNITGVNLINGVQVESHASRHLPNGSDPIATDIPVSIGSANSAGIANSFSRSDHVHAFDINNLITTTVATGSTDYIPIYNAGTGQNRKILVETLSNVYLKKDGSSTIGGSFNFNGYNITGVGSLYSSNINGNIIIGSNISSTGGLVASDIQVTGNITGCNNFYTINAYGNNINFTGTSTLPTINNTTLTSSTINNTSLYTNTMTGANINFTGTSRLTNINSTTINSTNIYITNITGNGANFTGTSILNNISNNTIYTNTMTGTNINFTGTSVLNTINNTTLTSSTINNTSLYTNTMTGSNANFTGTTILNILNSTNINVNTMTGNGANFTGTSILNTLNSSNINVNTMTGDGANFTGTSKFNILNSTNQYSTNSYGINFNGENANFTGTSTFNILNVSSFSVPNIYINTITGSTANFTGTSYIASISGCNSINGISINTHASRHQPDGIDGLLCGLPVSITTANNTGTANTFARSDHTHDIDINGMTVGSVVDTANDYIPMYDSSLGTTIKIVPDDFDPFGKYFSFIGPSVTGTNSSSNLQTILTYTTPVLSIGTYRVATNFNWAYGSTTTSRNFIAQLLIDGTVVWNFKSSINIATELLSACGFVFSTFATASAHTFLLRYGTNTPGTSATIANAHIEVWRVS